jgi:transcriptional regulator with GAF, ATPase, and Fis domain
VASGLKSATGRLHSPVARALIGEHPHTARLRALIERVAQSDATVLISGESGTGKEVVARAIHASSPRAEHNFVPVNCAAIPHEMLESEMFGHERGAFTGAVAPRQGLFGMADSGTIFLDEISEMPIALQAKLLRVLEDRSVRPLGADRSSQVDVRVIAATNKDLARAARKGAFREDLFYRLQVVPIIIPPLRERRSDIPLLIDYFLQQMSARLTDRHWSMSKEALVRLWSYDWPGNVRELENMVERLAILSEGPVIEAALLPENLLGGSRNSEPRLVPSLGEGEINLTAMVREFEGRLINEALRRTHGNKQAAARLLGLKRTTFSAKLRRCGVLDCEPDEDRRDPQGDR